MADMKSRVDEFLAQKRIAVAGVSSEPGGHGTGNLIYRKFRDAGYQVFPVNPRTVEVEGTRCYASLKDIPGGVDAVVAVTPPEGTNQVVHDCADLGIKHVWMHGSFMAGSSVSQEAVAFCKANGIDAIDGACPMMYLQADLGHKCMRWWMGVTGKLPN